MVNLLPINMQFGIEQGAVFYRIRLKEYFEVSKS